MDQETSVILGGEKDFQKFLGNIPKWNKNDLATLRRYWSITVKRKNYLVIKHVGTRWAMVTIIKEDCLPLLHKNKPTKCFAKGWVGLHLPKEKYFVFGAMVLEQEEIVTFHKEIPAAPIIEAEEPPKKRRGRPKKVA